MALCVIYAIHKVYCSVEYNNLIKNLIGVKMLHYLFILVCSCVFSKS